jgi:hypothetical protein
VKLYENVHPLPRAFVVHHALAAAEDEAALHYYCSRISIRRIRL